LFKVLALANSHSESAAIEIDMLTILAMKIITDAIMPHLVKVPAMFSSLIWRGVFEVVSSFSSFKPLLLLAPTAQTTAFPTPVETRVDERRKGSGLS
jgi:hypothetical protein